jgi:hypothetical protein
VSVHRSQHRANCRLAAADTVRTVRVAVTERRGNTVATGKQDKNEPFLPLKWRGSRVSRCKSLVGLALPVLRIDCVPQNRPGRIARGPECQLLVATGGLPYINNLYSLIGVGFRGFLIPVPYIRDAVVGDLWSVARIAFTVLKTDTSKGTITYEYSYFKKNARGRRKWKKRSGLAIARVERVYAELRTP